jgi:O-methyltransferase
MRFMKNSIKKLFHHIGYSIVKNNPMTSEFPVESTARERGLMSEILALDQYGFTDNDKRLSMVSVSRLWAAISAVKYVVDNELPGDIVECGVWRGGCALAMASTLEYLKSDKKVFLYDTFSGMTEPGDADIETLTGLSLQDEYNRRKIEGNSSIVNWDYGDISVKKVSHEFHRRGLGDRVVFVEGDVRETLSPAMKEPSEISILRLDTDWYDTTLHELNVLYPRLVSRGVLLVDDYGHFDGARKAVDEYMGALATRPMTWVTDYTGRGYIA